MDVGAQKDRATKEGVTPLQIAARNGHIAVVQLLIDVDSDIDMLLFKAAFCGQVRVMEELLKDPSIDINQCFYGATALSWAAQGGHTA